jgi:hypothetical protein
MLEFYEPNTGNTEIAEKLGLDLDKTYRNAANMLSHPRFKVGQKGNMQQHKVDNNKKAGTPQHHKINYCGPLDTEST